MRVRLYGTRGSSPVCRGGTRHYGGNTTCLRILSCCLPPDTALLIDAGSGFVEASRDLLAEGVRKVLLLMTHYHHDHTQGFPIARLTHEPSVGIEVFGPREHGMGPGEVFEDLMRAPHFPVPFEQVQGHVRTHGLEAMETQVLLVHPEAGIAWQASGRADPRSSPGVVEIGGRTVPARECLRLRMARTDHPGYTLSYRLEEGPTGRVAVLLTDHEASEEVPSALRDHLDGVHLLLLDAQYTRSQWQESYRGYGHGTGAFAAIVLRATGALRLGLTHHDPEADDEQVDFIREEARRTLEGLGFGELGDRLFSARTGQEEEV